MAATAPLATVAPSHRDASLARASLPTATGTPCTPILPPCLYKRTRRAPPHPQTSTPVAPACALKHMRNCTSRYDMRQAASGENGLPGATRTRGQLLRRQLLFPPELRGAVALLCHSATRQHRQTHPQVKTLDSPYCLATLGTTRRSTPFPCAPLLETPHDHHQAQPQAPLLHHD